jgi:serine/threonine-protein kinase
VVAGRFAFGVGQSQHTPVAATSSAAPAEPTAAHTGPWQAYDFVANTLPGLMPDTPSGVSYQGGTCQAINARFDPIDQLETGVPVARIMCRPKATQSSYIANYIVICSSDRTPQTLAGVADGLTAVRNEQWSRAGGSGQVIYGDHNGAGALAVSFDNPSRSFCSVVANGNDGTSGQDVYDHWFRDAPL